MNFPVKLSAVAAAVSAQAQTFGPDFVTDYSFVDLGSPPGVPTPLGAEASALYTMFVKSGRGDLDYSAIIKMLQDS